jgi:hypothetical protein
MHSAKIEPVSPRQCLSHYIQWVAFKESRFSFKCLEIIQKNNKELNTYNFVAIVPG